MPTKTRVRPANYAEVPICLACGKPLTRDNWCRTRGCPNHFPDPAEARAAALALAHQIAKQTRRQENTP